MEQKYPPLLAVAFFVVVTFGVGFAAGTISSPTQTVTQTPQACKDLIRIDRAMFDRLGTDMGAYDFAHLDIATIQINATTQYITDHTAERHAAVAGCEGA
jgi:hypothetical protein